RGKTLQVKLYYNCGLFNLSSSFHRSVSGLSVRGPSAPLVAPLGSSVVLLCSVDEPLPVEGLEVEWRRTDSETLVHLYQDGASQTEAQQQDYHDRAHFFTDQIQHGNFSLRLDDLRAEDEGQYTCTVHSQQDSGETVVQINVDVERLLVSGSSRSISASVGEDVTLNCSVSHITLQDIEEVSWKKTDEDEDILVLLFQNNQTLSDSSDERYRDRVEFFTDEIPKGNISLRLKSVRTEDKGVYMCEVLAGGLTANTTVELERLGFSVSHIMVLILCVSASGSALLLCCLIYCRNQNGLTVTYSQNRLVFLGSSMVLNCYRVKPLQTEDLKVEWRRKDTETLVHLYQDGESRAQQDYQNRAHFFTDQIQQGNFSLRLDDLRAEDEGQYTCTVYNKQRSVFSTQFTLEKGK
uniref:Ig-like domain-containing protein n=1 Tax=Cyprinus carpio TaxID=7962 RepID=A0A8C2CFW9_CYPCA